MRSPCAWTGEGARPPSAGRAAVARVLARSSSTRFPFSGPGTDRALIPLSVREGGNLTRRSGRTNIFLFCWSAGRVQRPLSAPRDAARCRILPWNAPLRNGRCGFQPRANGGKTLFRVPAAGSVRENGNERVSMHSVFRSTPPGNANAPPVNPTARPAASRLGHGEGEASASWVASLVSMAEMALLISSTTMLSESRL